MILIREIRILRTEAAQDIQPLLKNRIERKLKLRRAHFSFRILKHTLDARKKPQIFDVYTVCVDGLKDEQAVLVRLKDPDVIPYMPSGYAYADPATEHASASGAPAVKIPGIRPVIIGAGPAGLFCGLLLAMYGRKPLILERGGPVESRSRDVSEFWETGRLNPDSNVQFGEGGAGTFSDGKLLTRIHDPEGRIRFVLEQLVRAGAPEEILTETRAHIGTDCLKETVIGIREMILDLGGEIRYGTCVSGLETDFECCVTAPSARHISAVVLRSGEKIPAKQAVLAAGHSARDTFRMLQKEDILLEAKDFAVGFRILHPQSFIDSVQYGLADPESVRKLRLPPSIYEMSAKAGGRSVYSFCMCPGGLIVNASSEEGRLCVNGMSNHDRNSGFANSGLVVTALKTDFPGNDPLRGMYFQEHLEETAFRRGKGSIPVQRGFVLFEHLSDTACAPDASCCSSDAFIHPAFCGRIREASMKGLLPEELENAYTAGLGILDKKIPGFITGDGVVFAGIESRTSSPVRIVRGDTLESSLHGLYPCGEGAGYAGGIISAAVDGLKVAEAILRA